MTQNGNYYRIFRMDSKTYSLSEIGHVGETEYDPSRWATFGDSFASLIVNAEHVHVWGEWVVITEATDDAAGEKEHTCLLCGETESEKIPATGTTEDPGDNQKPGSGGNANTADSFLSGLWIMVLMTSICGVSFLSTFRKKFMA
jgi:hypothetical protein